MINPCSFSICDTTNWVLDIGSPYHICNSLQGLQVSRRFENGERFSNMGNESQAPVLALGIVTLFFESYKVVPNDCHYCPSFLVNIISVCQLTINGYELLIKNDFCKVIMNDSVVMIG